MSGFVLGATSRIVFLLPAALMALMVAAVLVVRADIDLGFTALAATLLNGGFLLGIVMASAMSRLLISRRGTIDETASGFVVRDRFGRARACVGFGERRPTGSGQPAHARRGAADRRQLRKVAGAGAARERVCTCMRRCHNHLSESLIGVPLVARFK